MPNRDGTGPEGKGPMTGRRQGRCAPKNSDQENPPSQENGPGRGLGRGFGRGRGRGLGRWQG